MLIYQRVYHSYFKCQLNANGLFIACGFPANRAKELEHSGLVEETHRDFCARIGRLHGQSARYPGKSQF